MAAVRTLPPAAADRGVAVLRGAALGARDRDVDEVVRGRGEVPPARGPWRVALRGSRPARGRGRGRMSDDLSFDRLDPLDDELRRRFAGPAPAEADPDIVLDAMRPQLERRATRRRASIASALAGVAVVVVVLGVRARRRRRRHRFGARAARDATDRSRRCRPRPPPPARAVRRRPTRARHGRATTSTGVATDGPGGRRPRPTGTPTETPRRSRRRRRSRHVVLVGRRFDRRPLRERSGVAGVELTAPGLHRRDPRQRTDAGSRCGSTTARPSGGSGSTSSNGQLVSEITQH